MLEKSAENAEELEKATNELMQASHKMAEIIYSQKDNNQNQDQKPEESTEEPTEEPIDTDINQ